MKYAIIAVLLLVVFFMALPQPQAEFPSNSFVIGNVKIFDGENVLKDQDVIVSNGIVKQIGPSLSDVDLPYIEGQGKTLIPGLVDAHTHVYADALAESINFGVTTSLDMFAMPQLINPMQQLREDKDSVTQADVFSATILATAPEGHGTEYGFKIPVINAPEEAEHFVKQRIAEGADYIKIVYDKPGAPFEFSPSISVETLKALVEHSHKAGKMAVAHIDDLQSAKDAVNAGIDGLIHSFMDEVADDELIAMMKQKEVFIVPTLVVEASLAQLPIDKAFYQSANVFNFLNENQLDQLKSPFSNLGFTPKDYDIAKQSIARFQKAGIRILAGSDAPNPGTAHGVSIHQELIRLVDAGLSPVEALRAATGNANKAFNIGYRGTIAVDQPATFLLINGDPTLDIKRSSNIAAIWKNGAQFERIKTKKQNITTEPLSPTIIADFNEGEIKPHWGKQLQQTVDTVVGGKSKVALSLADGGFVVAKGEVKKGFAYPWAGMQFDLGRPSNLSKLSHLQFKAKGDIDGLYIMLFQKGSYQPIMQMVTLDKHWQDYSIELSGFNNADLANVTSLAWVASQQIQTFEFAIDDIQLK